MSQTQPTPPPILKGSWEDLLLQGQQLAARQNDEAIPHLQKLIDRLSRLPASQRRAANGRLDSLLLRASVDLQYYLTYRDRYAEALAVNAVTRNAVPASQILSWDMHAAAMRIQSGAIDEGLAAMRMLAETGGIDIWGDALFASLSAGHLDEAAAAVRGAELWVNRTHAGAFTTDDARHDLAFLAYLKARLAVAQANPVESAAWFEQAMALDPFYAENPHYLYTHLMEIGAYAEAQKLLQVDRQSPIRAGFWQGLLHRRRNQPAEAERQWQKVAMYELPEDGNVDYLELVLAHYYLGDREGIGLGSVLKALQEDAGFWGLFFLAGLGWAMRGDLAAARTDMQLAHMRRKSMAEGSKLSNNWWQFCTDLLDEERQQALVGYFENAQVQRRT